MNEKDKEILELKLIIAELRHIYLLNVDVEKKEIKTSMKDIINIWERVNNVLK